MAQSRCWFCDRPVDPSMAVEDGGVTFCSGSCANEHRRTLGRAEQASRKYPQRVVANPGRHIYNEPLRCPCARCDGDRRNPATLPGLITRVRMATNGGLVPHDSEASLRRAYDAAKKAVTGVDPGAVDEAYQRLYDAATKIGIGPGQMNRQIREGNPDDGDVDPTFAWAVRRHGESGPLTRFGNIRIGGRFRWPNSDRVLVKVNDRAYVHEGEERRWRAGGVNVACVPLDVRSANPTPFSAADNAEALAAEFSRVLARWLGPKKMAEVIRRNRAHQSDNICASGDFCDSNMAMEEAFKRALGRKPVLATEGDEAPALRRQYEEDVDLWNQAWDLAKAAEFRPLSIGKRSRNPGDWDRLQRMGRAAARRFVEER